MWRTWRSGKNGKRKSFGEKLEPLSFAVFGARPDLWGDVDNFNAPRKKLSEPSSSYK